MRRIPPLNSYPSHEHRARKTKEVENWARESALPQGDAHSGESSKLTTRPGEGRRRRKKEERKEKKSKVDNRKMLVSSSGRNESLNTCALILHFPLPENQSQRRRALPRIERRHQRQQVPSQSLCVFKGKKKEKKRVNGLYKKRACSYGYTARLRRVGGIWLQENGLHAGCGWS